MNLWMEPHVWNTEAELLSLGMGRLWQAFLQGPWDPQSTAWKPVFWREDQ